MLGGINKLQAAALLAAIFFFVAGGVAALLSTRSECSEMLRGLEVGKHYIFWGGRDSGALRNPGILKNVDGNCWVSISPSKELKKEIRRSWEADTTIILINLDKISHVFEIDDTE